VNCHINNSGQAGPRFVQFLYVSAISKFVKTNGEANGHVQNDDVASGLTFFREKSAQYLFLDILTMQVTTVESIIPPIVRAMIPIISLQSFSNPQTISTPHSLN